MQSFPIEILAEIGLKIDDFKVYLNYLSLCKKIKASDRLIHSIKREEFKIWKTERYINPGIPDEEVDPYEVATKYQILPNGVKDGLSYEWEQYEDDEPGEDWWNPSKPYLYSYTYVNGIKHGPWHMKTKDEYIVGNFHNGVRHGNEETYKDNKLSRVIQYDIGKGLQIDKYESGSLKRKANYDDQISGLVEEWYPDGKRKCLYWKEQDDNPSLHWDENGDLKALFIQTRDGKERIIRKPNGIITRRVVLNNGCRLLQGYDQNERPIFEFSFDENERPHGTSKAWHPGTDQLESRCNFDHGKLHGLYETWARDGTDYHCETWENDVLVGTNNA